MGYIVVPKEPTTNKDELVAFVANIFVEDVSSTEGYEGIKFLKSLNNAMLLQLHDGAIKEYDYLVSNFIKKSIKLCYGGSRFFGLSSVERNNYITDLRKAIQRY